MTEMKFSYNKLWKLLIDNKMLKKDLISLTGINSSTIAKLSKDKQVSMEVLEDIESVITFRLANYFLRFSQEYKRLHPDEKFMDWYEFVEYGCTNPYSIWLQRNGFSREAATYIQNNFQYYFAYGEENEYRLKKILFDCDNASVRKEAIQVYYNSPEIYV